MYVNPNFKTKKELKLAVAEGKPVTIYSPGPFPAPQEGIASVEGPHYPRPHRWYASVLVKAGRVVKILS